MPAMSAYESKVWNDLTRRESPSPTKPGSVFAERIGTLRSTAGNRARQLADRAPAHVKDGAVWAGDGFKKTLQGMSEATIQASAASLSESRILQAFQRAGHDVATLEDIRALDLRMVDKVVHGQHLQLMYGSGSAATGAGAGLATTGGGAAVAAGGVLGMGAGAAPGVGAIVGAMAADAVAVLALTTRVAGHVGMLYGYHPDDPEEQMFLMSVLGLGVATSQAAKSAAMRDLNKLTQQLARRATWKQLNEAVFTQIVQRFAAQFGVRVTQKKLGQAVPLAGIAIGAGVNYTTVSRTYEAAYWAYRRRFLVDKYPEFEQLIDEELGEMDAEVVREGGTDEAAEPEQIISVLDIVEEVRAAGSLGTDGTPDADVPYVDWEARM